MQNISHNSLCLCKLTSSKMSFSTNSIIQIRNFRTSLYFILDIATIQSQSTANSLPLGFSHPHGHYAVSVPGTLHIFLLLNWYANHILPNSPLITRQFGGFQHYGHKVTQLPLPPNSRICSSPQKENPCPLIGTPHSPSSHLLETTNPNFCLYKFAHSGNFVSVKLHNRCSSSLA